MFISNFNSSINFNLHQIIKFIIEGWKAYLSKINDINEKHFLTLHIWQKLKQWTQSLCQKHDIHGLNAYCQSPNLIMQQYMSCNYVIFVTIIIFMTTWLYMTIVIFFKLLYVPLNFFQQIFLIKNLDGGLIFANWKLSFTLKKTQCIDITYVSRIHRFELPSFNILVL
jgi:hypothetical protein